MFTIVGWITLTVSRGRPCSASSSHGFTETGTIIPIDCNWKLPFQGLAVDCCIDSIFTAQ